MRHIRLELLLLTGLDAGRRFELGPAAMVLGRSPQVSLPFPQDSFLSSAHLQLVAEADGTGVSVTDLGSTNGTFLNEKRTQQALAVPGDVIRAGSQSLRVVPALPPEEDSEPVLSNASGAAAGGAGALAALLGAGGLPLFAVVDAAVDPLVLEHLRREPGHNIQSLYEGNGAQELAPWAPYLVELRPGSSLLQALLDGGWGKAWATFCTTAVPFAELRRHLRRFLMVHLESGPQVYFRFYDPRVLRDFLPTATHAEILYFFGPVQEWLMEGADPQILLRSRCGSAGLVTEALPVALGAAHI